MDDYYYYDFADGDEDTVDIIEDYSEPHYAADLHDCILPSVSQVSLYVGRQLGWNLLLRISWTLARRLLPPGQCECVQHLASVALGFAALYFNSGHEFLIVLFLSLVAYVLMLVLEYRKSRNMGAGIAIATIGAHFLYEFLWNQPESWHRLRGLQMVAAMKIISLAFDVESMKQKLFKDKQTEVAVPALVPYLGYVFCPANCIAGPWLPYSAYLHSMRGSVKGRRWLLWSVLNAVLAMVFLCLSNCVVPLLCSDRAWLWLRTYRDALTVRCSHYFICFLSQATMSTAGVAPTTGPPNAILGHLVAKPWRIEFPRSLSSLVRSWNIPMHDWLKAYIFRAAHQRFGSYLAAILSTYLVSSLLHGIYLKIYLVLLSLACFAYVESVLRAKLADIFNACITASACRGGRSLAAGCRFQRCPSRNVGGSWRGCGVYAVLLVNFLFGALTVLHLAYLGVMMHDFNFEDEDVGTAAAAGVWNWSRLNFLSHWVTLASYIFYYLV